MIGSHQFRVFLAIALSNLQAVKGQHAGKELPALQHHSHCIYWHIEIQAIVIDIILFLQNIQRNKPEVLTVFEYRVVEIRAQLSLVIP